MASSSIYNNPDLEVLRKFQNLEKYRQKGSGKDTGSNKNAIDRSTLSKLREAIRKETTTNEPKEKTTPKLKIKTFKIGESIIKQLKAGSTYVPKSYPSRKRYDGRKQTPLDYISSKIPKKDLKKYRDENLAEKPEKQTRTYLNVLEGPKAKAFSSMRKKLPNYRVIGAEIHKFVQVQGENGEKKIATLIMNLPK